MLLGELAGYSVELPHCVLTIASVTEEDDRCVVSWSDGVGAGLFHLRRDLSAEEVIEVLSRIAEENALRYAVEEPAEEDVENVEV